MSGPLYTLLLFHTDVCCDTTDRNRLDVFPDLRRSDGERCFLNPVIFLSAKQTDVLMWRCVFADWLLYRKHITSSWPGFWWKRFPADLAKGMFWINVQRLWHAVDCQRKASFFFYNAFSVVIDSMNIQYNDRIFLWTSLSDHSHKCVVFLKFSTLS